MLKIKASDAIYIAGLTGCGKTTTCYTLAGIKLVKGYINSTEEVDNPNEEVIFPDPKER